jgi:adenylosuccinate lyase
MSEWDSLYTFGNKRYGSPEMRQIWGEAQKRAFWRKVWVCLAQVQSEFGLVLPEQVEDLKAHVEQIDLARALQLESEIHHNLLSELRTFSEQCAVGGPCLNQGVVSGDIEDNADALRLSVALDLIIFRLYELLHVFEQKIEIWADLPVLFTAHNKGSEPYTLGYFMAWYAQELLDDWRLLQEARKLIRARGFTGTPEGRLYYIERLGQEQVARFDQRIGECLGLPIFSLPGSIYPRKQDYSLLTALAGLGSSLHKFGLDLRLLQTQPFMDFNKNYQAISAEPVSSFFIQPPILAEKINSLARSLAETPQAAWHNASRSLMEKMLDDQSNRRALNGKVFTLCDEILQIATRMLNVLEVNEQSMLGFNKNYFEKKAKDPKIRMVLEFQASQARLLAGEIRQSCLISNPKD